VDFRRKGWTFRSGGDNSTAASGSGFFRTSDGARPGQTSTKKLEGTSGETVGRVAVTIAPSNPDVVYTLIESNHSALYRSADGGKNLAGA